MKARNKREKKVVELNSMINGYLTARQFEFACKHSFLHYGFRNSKKEVVCMDCGHTFIADGKSAICPSCGMKLKLEDTKKRNLQMKEYFCLLTTINGIQTLRFFLMSMKGKKGCPAQYEAMEVVRNFIFQDGMVYTCARTRHMSYYIDLWNFSSDIELRRNNSVYNIYTQAVYFVNKTADYLTQRGFKKNFHQYSPTFFFQELIRNSVFETLLKTDIRGLNHYGDIKGFWKQYLICKRNGYKINDISLWKDLLLVLKRLGKDINNPYYICPENLKKAHDYWLEKEKKEIAKERLILEREREKQRIARIEEDNERYINNKSAYFGLIITDGFITLRVLQNVQEFKDEGTAMHHCVFSNEYYKKDTSLIFSARINDERIETVEYSLDIFKVVQSFGVCNQITEYHDRIIKLIESNSHLIKSRMRVA